MKFTAVKKNLFNVLFWSIVSAAFIGPGTITTAAKAGALFGFDLLWALLFSTIACLVLQEACARLTIVSGMSLGQAIKKSYQGSKNQVLVMVLIGGAIIVGSAAYQTGNFLGATEGVVLVSNISQEFVIICLGLGVFLILSLPKLNLIARILGGIVAIMGIVFLSAFFLLRLNTTEILLGLFIPRFPNESSLYILGLIGTTVVPYNLFLGSGMSTQGQSLQEMRIGLSVAVILGGVISMTVLAIGTIVSGEFSFLALSEALESRLGGWVLYFLAIGLAAAGFSSAITAPLAASLTAQSLFAGKNSLKWTSTGLYFKLVWITVLLTGVLFGISGTKPIPAIILAQALNGMLLPFISIFLLYVVNDPKIMTQEGLNNWWSNILMSIVVWASLVMGLINVAKAGESATNLKILDKPLYLQIILLISVLISAGIGYQTFFKRKKT